MIKTIIAVAIVIALFSAVILARAEVSVTASVPCNNLNYKYSEKCNAPPVFFATTTTGWRGELTSGVTFTQDWVTPDMMVFKMENVRYLVYKDMVVYY